MTTIRCYPGCKNPTHYITLEDRDRQKWGFLLTGGPRGVQEAPATPSTIQFTSGGSKFGDWEPGMSHIEQRDFSGGRGSDDFSADNRRFWDSQNLFTMLQGKVIPSIQWRLPAGLRTFHSYLPQDSDDYSWIPLTGSNRYVSDDFTVGGSNLSADNVFVMLRRIGNPGTGYVKIYTDSSGSPSSAVSSASATITTDDITDVISEWRVFDLSAAGDLTASTKYHVVVYGASTDNDKNHWEICVDGGTSGSKSSTAGSSWSTASYTIFFRVTDTDTSREFRCVEIYGALLAFDKLASGGNSTMYLYGEIGVVTAADSTTVTDSNEGEDGAWADDEWNGYYIKFTTGAAKGHSYLITDTTSAGVITTAAKDVTPSAGDVYVIYGGNKFNKSYTNATTGIGAIKDIAVMNNIIYIAQGSGDNVRRVTYDSATHGFAYADDSTNKSDKLFKFQDPVDGPQLWRGENDTVDISRASAAAWGTDLSFNTEILVKDSSHDIINIHAYDKKPIVFKADGLYYVSNDRVEQADIGLDFIKTLNNGQAVLSHKEFLFFSWGNYSLQRLYGATLDSVGYNEGRGLPSGRKGKVSWLASHPVGIFVCVDAGTSGTSSLLFRDDLYQGWHEIFRAPGSGQRIRHIYWQDNPGTRPRLWIECNGELYYQEWPQDTLNPLEDSDVCYVPEAVLVLSDIDMGAARLKKYFKELTCITENLADEIQIRCEVQVDDINNQYIGSTTWIPMEHFLTSPEYSVPIKLGEAYRIRIRLRLFTDTTTTPAILNATVLEGYARTPVKRQWNIRANIKTAQRTIGGRAKDHDPDELLTWLRNASFNTKGIEMRSIWEDMDGLDVIVEPPSVFRSIINYIQKKWGATIHFTIREA